MKKSQPLMIKHQVLYTVCVHFEHLHYILSTLICLPVLAVFCSIAFLISIRQIVRLCNPGSRKICDFN